MEVNAAPERVMVLKLSLYDIQLGSCVFSRLCHLT